MVYLLYNAGNKQKALIAYLATAVVIQITVVYSVLPLLWKSVLNLVVILALNVYTFMTGGWILLLFEDFRFRDADLLILIEAGLFSMYPAVFIILVTWTVAIMTSVTLAPYVLMLVGFLILQVFLTPLMSSFVKNHPQGSLAVWDLPSGYILDPNAVATIAGLYAAASPFLVIVISLVTGWRSLFSMLTLVQVLFVASISVFLATFLNLRLFLDSRGIQQKHLLILRWSASFVAMALLVPFLVFLEIRLSLLPWLPLILALYISIIICHLQRHKAAVRASLLMLLLGFFLIFSQLPSALNYNVPNGTVSMTVLLLVLALNAVLCIVSIYCAIFASNDAFGLCLLVLSGCSLHASQVLLTSQLLPFFLLLLLSAVFIYLSIRLYHSNKLSWQHSLLIAALHLTTLANNISDFCPESKTLQRSSDGLLNVFGFLSILFLFVMILHVFVFEQQNDIRQFEILRDLVFLVAALMCNAPFFMTNLLCAMLGMEPVFSAYLGLGSFIVSCAYLKLAFFNKSRPSQSKYYTAALVVIPVITFVLQPQLSLQSIELQKWSIVIGVLCVLLALPLATIHRNSLHIIGACFGMPLALCCLYLMFPSSPSLLIQLTVGVKVFVCLILLLIAWQNPKNSGKWIKTLGLVIGVTSFALLTLESAFGLRSQKTYFGVTLASASSFLVAVVIKFHYSEYEQNQLEGRFAYNRQLFGVAVLGNIHAVASFALFVVQWKSSDFWYIWVSIFSLCLLLLNRDDLLLGNLSKANRFAPVAMAASLTLYVAAILDCRLLTLAATTWTKCIGVIELLALLLVTPVLLNFWTICWWSRYWWSDKLVVFLTPVFFLFIFVGQSYASWTLAVFGFAVSAWLMKCKLPLEIDR